MNEYKYQDYFTPEAIELIGESEIIGIDGVTEHAVVLLSCDEVPYAAMIEDDGRVHAGGLIQCLPSPGFALSEGLRRMDDDGTLDGLCEFGVYAPIGKNVMFQPLGGSRERVEAALAYLRGFIPDVVLEEVDGLFLFR